MLCAHKQRLVSLRGNGRDDYAGSRRNFWSWLLVRSTMPSWGTGTSVLVRPTEKHTCCSVGLASLTRLVLPHRVGSPPVTEQLSKQLETHLHTVLEALRLRQPQEATVRLPAGLTDAQVRPNQACSSIVPWDQRPLRRHVPRGHL